MNFIMITWKQSNAWLISWREWKNSQIHDWSTFKAVKYMTENVYTRVWRNKCLSVSKITAVKYMTWYLRNNKNTVKYMTVVAWIKSNTWLVTIYCVKMSIQLITWLKFHIIKYLTSVAWIESNTWSWLVTLYCIQMSIQSNIWLKSKQSNTWLMFKK